MQPNDDVARISKVLANKQSISICLPQNPTFDAIAAATALYIALGHEEGKTPSLACAGEISPDFKLNAQEEIHQNLVSDGDILVVSFPYEEGAVDKVTYKIEDDRFNLLVKPREGKARLKPEQVEYVYTGGKPDVIVTLYAPTLNSLGDLHAKNKDKFTGVEIINIDRHFTNANYGSVNYVDKKSSSMSEMVLEVIRAMNAKIDKDVSTNIYNGILSATNNFTSHSVGAGTFEASAFLMNHGAVKLPNTGSFGKQSKPTFQSFGSNPFAKNSPQAAQQTRQPVSQQRPPQGMQTQQNMQTQQAKDSKSEQIGDDSQNDEKNQQQKDTPENIFDGKEKEDQEKIKHHEQVIKNEQGGIAKEGTSENKEASFNSQPEGEPTTGGSPEGESSDWLKPKIFKGSKLI